MPLQALKQPKFNPPKESVVTWDTWRKGLNLLLRENEINGAEMVESTNLMLVGSGVPTKRWGTRDFFLAGPTTTQRSNFVMFAKDSSDNQQILALTDWGFLTKKSGTSYTMITGASWPSGADIQGTQLGNKVYLISPDREFVRYDFSTLTAFATLASPTGLAATNMSSASGSTTWSWRITAIGKSGGETLASTPISMPTLPQELTKTVMRITWTAVSAASGDLVGYNIYRGPLGDERWIGGVDDTTTTFDDPGIANPDPFRVVPLADTTGGPKGKYIIRYQDRLIIAGIPGQPTKVLISGRYPYQERFDWYAGGGYIYIEPDSGQNITGLGIHQEKLVIFKENSVWQVSLNQLQFGQYLILDPQYKLLTASQGCLSHRSIVPVENDLMFANRKGIYILRYEPQLLTVINANEISAKIRPFFENMTEEDHSKACAMYADKKYLLSFPDAKQIIVFDRERLSFVGPWKLPFGIESFTKYVDSAGTEHFIGSDANDAYITEFNKTFPDDKDQTIQTLFKSKKENFGDWTLFKTINEVYMNFRAIQGSVQVNIYLEQRDGNVVVAKTFTVTGTGSSGTSGIGTDGFGLALFGSSTNVPEIITAEQPRKSFIYKSARTFQVEVRTTNKTDTYELLGIKGIAISQARGNSPSSWNS